MSACCTLHRRFKAVQKHLKVLAYNEDKDVYQVRAIEALLALSDLRVPYPKPKPKKKVHK